VFKRPKPYSVLSVLRLAFTSLLLFYVFILVWLVATVDAAYIEGCFVPTEIHSIVVTINCRRE